MSELERAYKLMQDSFGFKAGDKVKVLREFGDKEHGHGICMNEDMYETIGMYGKVVAVYSDSGVRVKFDSGSEWTYPFYVLEKLNKPETVELGGKTYIKSELEEALRHIKPVGE